MLNAKRINSVVALATINNYNITKEIKDFVKQSDIKQLFSWYDDCCLIHKSDILIKNKKEFEFYEKFERLLQKQAKRKNIILN